MRARRRVGAKGLGGAPPGRDRADRRGAETAGTLAADAAGLRGRLRAVIDRSPLWGSVAGPLACDVLTLGLEPEIAEQTMKPTGAAKARVGSLGRKADARTGEAAAEIGAPKAGIREIEPLPAERP